MNNNINIKSFDGVNAQLLLDAELKGITESGKRPRLLLHACCAPCSSYVLEYLSKFFEITLYFYNPNITPSEEYAYRAQELARLVAEMGIGGDVSLFVSDYNSDEFYNIAKGFEEELEGGARCARCYRLRLEASARYAAERGFDYFTTTLSISPYKNSRWLNEIGADLSETYGVRYLYSDFKKKNGYKRSCELSEIHGLYRQDYCGCEFSRAQRDRKNNHR